MQALFRRLEQFSLLKDILQLKKGVSNCVWSGIPISFVVDDKNIYGREGGKKELKKYLMLENASGCKIRVISIVGLGGLGKKTLAKLLYNDQEVREKFDLKA